MISTVVQQHLGGGMSSVLFDQIREKKGWAYTVYASALQFLDSSIFTLYAAVKHEKVLDTLSVFGQELNKVSREGVPLADLRRIQDSLVYSYELSLESSESRMMSISSAELFFKRELSFAEYRRTVRSIRVADTQKLVQEWVKTGLPSIFVLGPKPKNRNVWKAVKTRAEKLTQTKLVVI